MNVVQRHLGILFAAITVINMGVVTGCRTSRPITTSTSVQSVTTIGIVLPLSGDFRTIGEGAQDAIKLASTINPAWNKSVRLEIRDSEGTSEGAARAVDELVLKNNAAAIVGPLFRSESIGAAKRAEALGVPIISCSNSQDVVRVGSYAFSIGFFSDGEMKDLVTYAMKTGGLTRFAALYPNVKYGQQMLAAFRAEVERRGGTIIAVEPYEQGQTTFTEPVRRLVGLEDPTVRPEYKEALKKCANAKDSYRRARCREQAKESIPPVIEFDGLFIPDRSRTIALLAHAVLAADVVVERDPRRLRRIEKTLKRKVEPVTLLGTSAWNSEELTKKAGRSVENAIFADGYFASAPSKTTRAFVTAFRKRFGRTPVHHEALAFDAIRWVAQTLHTERPKTTNELRSALHRDFDGASGALSFRRGTQVHRKHRILTVRGGRIVEADPTEGDRS